MGYQVTTVTPPNIAPSAAAAFPSMMIFPRLASIRRMLERVVLLQRALREVEARPAPPATFSSARLRLLPELLGDRRLHLAPSPGSSRRATTPTYAMFRSSFFSLASPVTGWTTLSNGTG